MPVSETFELLLVVPSSAVVYVDLQYPSREGPAHPGVGTKKKKKEILILRFLDITPNQ